MEHIKGLIGVAWALVWCVAAIIGFAVLIFSLVAVLRGGSVSLSVNRDWDDVPGPIEGDAQIKAWPIYFDAMWDGRKSFEVRKNDNDYQEGDEYYIREWIPDYDAEMRPNLSSGRYTGRWLLVEIVYVLSLDEMREFGFKASKLDKEWCVFGFKERSRSE